MKFLSKDRMLRLFTFFQKVNEQRHLYAIRTTFISTMPIMIVGAFATAFNNMPIPAYQQFMLGIFGEQWRSFGSLVFNGTTQIVTLMIVFGSSYHLVNWYNNLRRSQIHAGIGGFVALACYTIVSLPLQDADSLPFAMAGVTGLFVGMAISMIVAELFVAMSSQKRMNSLLSDDPNLAIPQAFTAVMPAVVIIVGFALLRVGLVAVGVQDSFGALVYRLLSAPYVGRANSVGTAQLFNVSTHLMWLFGIHGNNVLDEVAQSYFVPAMAENVAAVAAGLPAPNLVTKTLFDAFVYMGGAGGTLALLIALMLFGRARSYQTLLRYALPTSIFNINEPLIFGIPLVLNPIYAIPFVLTPVLMFTTTTLAMTWGLVPYTIAEVSWATPIFISGYAATGSIAGVLLQVFNLALAVAIYAPFVRFSERMVQFRFERAYIGLSEIITSDYSATRRLISRGDEIGVVARRLANQLEGAVLDGELYLNYQPIVNARSNTLHSVEALLRWNHPQHGLINPMVTVALAEETSRIDTLGLWILEQAVAQRAEWTRQGLPGFHVSVNASTRQLDAPLFHDQVRRILEKYEVPAAQLQIEITETAALIENEATRSNLARLHDMGVTIAMDDFGVGHSSLLYLRTQPISTLKLDGALTRDVIRQPANLDIIATIRDLCNLLKVEMITEYVDNERQLNLLMGVGAYLIQGWLYSPAIPGEELAAFIQKLANQDEPDRTGGEPYQQAREERD